MIGSSYFDCLVASVERIARHVYYPGIEEAVEQCLQDLDDLQHATRISADQRDALRIVLLGMTMSQPASQSNAA